MAQTRPGPGLILLELLSNSDGNIVSAGVSLPELLASQPKPYIQSRLVSRLVGQLNTPVARTLPRLCKHWNKKVSAKRYCMSISYQEGLAIFRCITVCFPDCNCWSLLPIGFCSFGVCLQDMAFEFWSNLTQYLLFRCSQSKNPTVEFVSVSRTFNRVSKAQHFKNHQLSILMRALVISRVSCLHKLSQQQYPLPGHYPKPEPLPTWPTNQEGKDLFWPLSEQLVLYQPKCLNSILNSEYAVTLWDNLSDIHGDLDSHDTGHQPMMWTYMTRSLDVFFASCFFCIQQLPACKYCSLPICSGVRICGLQMHCGFGDTVLISIWTQFWYVHEKNPSSKMNWMMLRPPSSSHGMSGSAESSEVGAEIWLNLSELCASVAHHVSKLCLQ